MQKEKTENELSLIEKVKLMSDLTGACQNPQVVEIIKGLPNGDRIFELFVGAIEKEVAFIMNGKQDEAPKELSNLLATTKQLNSSVDLFRDTIVGFMKTPLVEVLQTINKKLGGKDTPIQVPQQAQQTQQQQYQQSEPSDYSPRQRGLSISGS